MRLKSGEFEALGTTIMYELPEAFFKTSSQAIKTEAERIEAKFSRFIETSDVCQLNKHLNEWVEVDAEFYFLLKTAHTLQTISHDQLNFGTTTLLEHWGYDAGYNLKAQAPAIAVEPLEIKLKPGLVKINVPLDLGAFGKGYFLDQVCEILKAHNVETFMVNAGGDISFKTKSTEPPFKFFLEDPRTQKRLIGECERRHGFLCASSPSKRKWGVFHHLIKTKSAQPAEDYLITYVQGEDSGLIADALSTAFFVSNFKNIEANFAAYKTHFPSIEVLGVSAEGQIWRSTNFEGTLYQA